MQFTRYQKRVASWALIIALMTLLLWLLSSSLAPFAVAGVLAYALNPLVDRIDGLFRGKMPRWIAVAVVVFVLMLTITGIFMLVVPLFIKQAPALGQQVPQLFENAKDWIEAQAARYGVRLQLNLGTFKEWLQAFFQNSEKITQAGTTVASSLKAGTNVVMLVLGYLTLVPLALYYLLVDWDRFIGGLFALVPLRMRDSVRSFAQEADAVLGQYLRGQLLVMAIMAVFYSVGLMLFGLDLAWSIGIFTGIAMFIPYVGFAMGLVMAAIAGILQLGFAKAALMVAVVYGLGQLLESFYLTPRLVGERIGLHPLVVIFALLAFGQLFGFVGVLIALPASAVLLVAVRRMRATYLQSHLYKN
ncbi:MAG: AI-2E family transporter [Brachymonas sp.]|nr:AI-2E family transporter [Brachymonas sp.]